MRETPEKTRNSQSENILDPGMAQDYISKVFQEIEGRVTKKTFRTIEPDGVTHLGALFNLNEFLLNSQVRICSVAVAGTSRNSDSENREPTRDRSLNDPSTEVVFSLHQACNLKASELEESHHSGGLNDSFSAL